MTHGADPEDICSCWDEVECSCGFYSLTKEESNYFNNLAKEAREIVKELEERFIGFHGRQWGGSEKRIEGYFRSIPDPLPPDTYKGYKIIISFHHPVYGYTPIPPSKYIEYKSRHYPNED